MKEHCKVIIDNSIPTECANYADFIVRYKDDPEKKAFGVCKHHIEAYKFGGMIGGSRFLIKKVGGLQ